MSKGITIVGEPIEDMPSTRTVSFLGLSVVLTDMPPPMPHVVLGDGGYLVPPELIAAILGYRNKGKKCEPKT